MPTWLRNWEEAAFETLALRKRLLQIARSQMWTAGIWKRDPQPKEFAGTGLALLDEKFSWDLPLNVKRGGVKQVQLDPISSTPPPAGDVSTKPIVTTSGAVPRLG